MSSRTTATPDFLSFQSTDIYSSVQATPSLLIESKHLLPLAYFYLLKIGLTNTICLVNPAKSINKLSFSFPIIGRKVKMHVQIEARMS